MAKVTITIEDTDDSGVNVRFEWDPPIEDADAEATTAQRAAMICMDALQSEASDFEELEG